MVCPCFAIAEQRGLNMQIYCHMLTYSRYVTLPLGRWMLIIQNILIDIILPELCSKNTGHMLGYASTTGMAHVLDK